MEITKDNIRPADDYLIVSLNKEDLDLLKYGTSMDFIRATTKDGQNLAIGAHTITAIDEAQNLYLVRESSVLFFID